MKLKYILTIAAAAAFLVPMSSCSDFLDQEPDKILTDEQMMQNFCQSGTCSAMCWLIKCKISSFWSG